MKRLFLAVIIIILIASSVFALPTINKDTLSWTPPTTNTDGTPLTDLKGHRIYWATKTGVYDNVKSKDVGNVVTINIKSVIGPLVGTYYFVVTAYNSVGNESAFSNEVSAPFFLGVGAPVILEIK